MIDSVSMSEAEVQRILEDRARELARVPKQETASDGDAQEVLIIGLGGEQYGIHLEDVQEIQVLRGLAPVPAVPDFWAGLINLRGRLVPALDLSCYLGLAAAGSQTLTKTVVVSHGGLVVAFLVNEVNGVRRLSKDAVRPAVKESWRRGVDVVTGITSDLISLLDTRALLSDPRLVVDDAQ